MMKKKNGFLTFCFSFLPGIGQMYQGYMKRGVSILILFSLTIGISAITSMGIFAIPAIVIYAYSFFDTWNIRNKKEEDKYPEDIFIWDSEDIKEMFNRKGKENTYSKKTTLGVILLIFGVYLLFGTVLRRLSYEFNIPVIYKAINTVMRYMPPVIIASISIVFGIKCIAKK